MVSPRSIGHSRETELVNCSCCIQLNAPQKAWHLSPPQARSLHSWKRFFHARMSNSTKLLSEFETMSDGLQKERWRCTIWGRKIHRTASVCKMHGFFLGCDFVHGWCQFWLQKPAKQKVNESLLNVTFQDSQMKPIRYIIDLHRLAPRGLNRLPSSWSHHLPRVQWRENYNLHFRCSTFPDLHSLH